MRRTVAALALGSLLLAPLAASAYVPQVQIEELSPTAGLDAVPDKPGGAGQPVEAVYSPEGMGFFYETEPNGTPGTANALPGTQSVALGNIYPNGDLDYFSFTGTAGDRVYAATMTSFAAGATDTTLTLFGTDGTTVIEVDVNDGSFAASSSSIAGATLPANGTYYLQVRATSATSSMRPYHLYLKVQSGAPTAETEPNNVADGGQPLPAGGWVSGAINPAGDNDVFTMSLNSGDTVYLGLDLDPERDGGTSWNGRVGLGAFGNPAVTLVVNDPNTTSPNSEAFFFTVKDAGTYYAYVDPATASTGDPAWTYHLSVAVFPRVPATATCTTYTSTDVPVTIPTGPGLVQSTLTVPGNPIVADLDVSITLTHANMPDLDVVLTAPGGNQVVLFNDLGVSAQQEMNLTLDDEAAIPMGGYTVMSGMVYQPPATRRLDWFDRQNAGGTWTLQLYDDLAANGGELQSWSLTICEPPPPPSCPVGSSPVTVFSTDFEANNGAFTHSGVQDEWTWGSPAFAPITTCASGVNCWVTDLTGTYNASSNQNLLSPSIDLTGYSGPVIVRWAQKHQIENASWDNAFVDIQQAGGANPTRLWEWLGPTMSNQTVGSPTVTIPMSAGWSERWADISAYAGQSVEARFNLSSDTSVNFAGLAIDDFSVTACEAVVLDADLAITKTDGVATAVPGTNTTYTIVASNAGPGAVTGATVADTFPAACTSVTWTCVGAGGGTCTAAGAGNISDATVNLPAGGSVTYTATCSISPAATGTLVNTATVSSAVNDPNPGNNSATDTDTLTPQADLAVTKSDGLAGAVVGQQITYTIGVANPGPSHAPGTLVTDNFPANLTGVTWTCVAAGGATCTAAGSGNIADVVNLPAGGSVTYTATGTVGPMIGNLSNTATAATGAGVTDPVPGNNSATDVTAITSPADVTATKTVSGTFSPGGAVTYTVVLTNASASPQLDNPGDEFTDTLPAGVTYVNATASSGTAAFAGGVVSWNGSIPASGSVTITIEVTIDAGTTGQTITNQGTVYYDANGDGTNESQRDTDDPGLPGAADPTSFTVVGSVLEIPTLSSLGLAALALALAALAVALLRRRRVA